MFKVFIFILFLIVVVFFFALVFIYRLLLKPFSVNKSGTGKGIIKNVSSITESSVKTSWIEGKIEGQIEVGKRLILRGMSVEEAVEVAGGDVEQLHHRLV